MNDPITGLMRLGLTEYEARAYVATVSIAEGSVGDISQESGIPRARVYDIMERLAGKGFVEIGSSNPLRYRANDPKRVIPEILAELKLTVDDIVLQLDKKKKRISKSLTLVWLIPDERGINTRLWEMLDSSPNHVTLIASSRSLLLKYASMLSDISNRIKITAIIDHDAESFRGLLGQTKIMKPNKPVLFSKGRLRVLNFPSKKGERAVKIELIVISDCESMLVYEEDGERMAMCIEDSIIDSVLRSSLKDNIQNAKPI